MNKITGFEMAKNVQHEMNTRFSFLSINNIEINDSHSDPTITISLTKKISTDPVELLLIAEQQENNPNNIHFSLFNNDSFFTDLYNCNRGQYVKRNHQLAAQINDEQLVPENLYLIQSADGLPGVDFINIDSFVDAANLITTISDLFKNG